MNRRQFTLGAALLPLTASVAYAAYPEKPITVVIGWSAGGSTDIVARLLTGDFKAHLSDDAVGIVEPRPGNSGGVAAEWLMRQAPDGYALMLADTGCNAILPTMLAGGVPYDPVDDFTHIATIGTSPMVLIVSPDFPAENAQEAIDILRDPTSEQLNSANAGIGSPTHIASHLLQTTLGPDAKSRPVPYRSGAEMTLSIAKNETAWGVASLGSAAGMIQAGNVRALAVTDTQRFPSFPDVPTLTEGALPDFTFGVSFQVQGPAGMQPDVTDALNRALVAIIADPEKQERFIQLGMRAWDGPNTPSDARLFVEQELNKFKDVAELTGIQIDAG